MLSRGIASATCWIITKKRWKISGSLQKRYWCNRANPGYPHLHFCSISSRFPPGVASGILTGRAYPSNVLAGKSRTASWYLFLVEGWVPCMVPTTWTPAAPFELATPIHQTNKHERDAPPPVRSVWHDLFIVCWWIRFCCASDIPLQFFTHPANGTHRRSENCCGGGCCPVKTAAIILNFGTLMYYMTEIIWL